MNQTIREWMQSELPLHGVLACRVFFRDCSTLDWTSSGEFPPELMEQACRQLTEAAVAFEKLAFPTAKQRWIFERAELHCWSRGDGLVLALVTPRAESDPSPWQELYSQFEALQS